VARSAFVAVTAGCDGFGSVCTIPMVACRVCPAEGDVGVLNSVAGSAECVPGNGAGAGAVCAGQCGRCAAGADMVVVCSVRWRVASLVTCRVCNTCGTTYDRSPTEGNVGVLNSVADSAACVTGVSGCAFFGVGSGGALDSGPGTVHGNGPGADPGAGAGSLGADQGGNCATSAEMVVVCSVGRRVARLYTMINPINKQRIVYFKRGCKCIYVRVRQKMVDGQVNTGRCVWRIVT